MLRWGLRPEWPAREVVVRGCRDGSSGLRDARGRVTRFEGAEGLTWHGEEWRRVSSHARRNLDQRSCQPREGSQTGCRGLLTRRGFPTAGFTER